MPGLTSLPDTVPCWFQPLLAEMPGRGLVELVPEQMLVSGMACKQHCYENFVVCGDHRNEGVSKLTKVLGFMKACCMQGVCLSV